MSDWIIAFLVLGGLALIVAFSFFCFIWLPIWLDDRRDLKRRKEDAEFSRWLEWHLFCQRHPEYKILDHYDKSFSNKEGDDNE